MDIIGCTINYRPPKTVSLIGFAGLAEMTMPVYFYVPAFYLTRSTNGKLIWKMAAPSFYTAGYLFETEKEAKMHISNQGWVLLKRKYEARSFHWYKEGDL